MLKRAMSLFELRRRNGPSWLSLFAVIMMLVSPAVSQLLARCHDDPAETPPYHLHSPTASAMKMHSSSRPPACHDATSGHDACGYCALFAHHPVLQPVVDGPQPLVRWRFQHVYQGGREPTVAETHRSSPWARAPPPFAFTPANARPQV